MSVIFADSCCDLSPTELKKLGIETFSQTVVFNEKKSQYFVNKFDFANYYSEFNNKFNVEINFKLIKSKLNLAIESKQDILIICPDKKFSVLYNTIYKIVKELDAIETNIEIINSHNITLGYASVIYYAGVLNSTGVEFSELINKTKKYIKTVKTLILPEKLNFKIDSGTLSGGMLGYKPIVEYNMGNLNIMASIKGSVKILNEIISKIKFEGQNIADYPIAIMYGNNAEMAEKLKQLLVKQFGELNIWFKPYFVELNSYFGKNSILITYHIKGN